jgi:hypothetical protein
MSDLVKTVTVETLPVIAYQGVRVLTTDLLAQFYGATPKNILDNFANNEDRFVSGKHFFKLEGEELKEFKRLPRSWKTASRTSSFSIATACPRAISPRAKPTTCTGADCRRMSSVAS